MGLLENKIAIVTGAGGGLGSAVAKAYAAEGATVIVSVHRPGTGDELVAEINAAGKGKAVSTVTDVTNEESVAALVAMVVEQYGRLDIIVNSSGIIVRKSILEQSLEEWKKVIDIDLTGTFLTGKYAGKQMVKQQSGKIINIASIAGLTGYAYPSYAASKAGVVNLTRAMAWELGPQGINVNCISPGLVLTNLNRGMLEDKVMYAKVTKKVPSRRLGLPEEIAQTAVFLASENSNYYNGACLTIDGGTTCYFNLFED